MSVKIKNCPFCNGKMKLITDYSIEYVQCTKCKIESHIEVGDYYDEGFMFGDYIIDSWNEVVDYINSQFLKKEVKQ